MLSWLLATALAVQANALPVRAPVELPPSPEQVLAVPAELRAALQAQVVQPTHSRRQRLERLLDFMFRPGGLGLTYQADASYTVAETWRTRKANCLGFTLMTVALAREAGLPAYAQEVDRVLSWQLDGDIALQNTHVNAGVTINDERLVVDVASDVLLNVAAPRRIDDRRLLALYYNNRAMQLLVQGHTVAARAWMDAALAQDADPMLWNNAGVLSLRMGNPADAERLFLKALHDNPRHAAALFNLVDYYRQHDQPGAAARWQARAERVLRKDPIEQFSQGLRSERAGDYPEAVRRFRKAIALDRDQQLFHFGLARAYLRLGELRLADSELIRAQDLSQGDQRARYQSKLEALRRLQRR